MACKRGVLTNRFAYNKKKVQTKNTQNIAILSERFQVVKHQSATRLAFETEFFL